MPSAGTSYIEFSGDFTKLRAQVAAEGTLASRTFASRFSGLQPVLSQQQRNLRAIGTASRYAAGGLGLLGGAAAAAAVKSGLQFNATMESNELALSRFVGGSKEARKYLDELFQTAKRTPFEFTDLTSAARRLMAFGLEADKTQRLLAATGDAIAAMGGGAENIDKVTLALGQMQAKGKVSAEELLQLSEAGIPAYKILEEQLGLTGEQVANIGNEGISANKAINALVVGMEERFGGAARQQAKTFEGMTSTLKDNWAQMTGAMTEGLFHELRDRWLPELNDTAEQITGIWNRKNLTPEEKFEASFDRIERNFGPLIRDLGDRIGDLDLGKRFGDVVSAALPVIAEAGGEAALGFLKGFGSAFAESDFLGKLFLGGMFVRYLGGWGAIGDLGRRIGGRLGAGMGAGIPTGAPTTVPGAAPSGPTSRVGGVLDALPLLGAAAYAGAEFESKNGVAGSLGGLTSYDKYIAENIEGSYEVRRQWIDALEAVSQKDRETTRDRIRGLREAGDISEEAAHDMLASLRLVSEGAERQRRDFRRSKGFGFAEAMAKDRKLSGREIDGMLDDLKELPKGARQEAAESMIGMARVLEQKGKLPEGATKRLRDAVVDTHIDLRQKSVRESAKYARELPRNFDQATGAVSEAINKLAQNTNKALGALGVKKLDFGIQATGDAVEDAGKVLGRQRGGLIPGSGDGDTVPVMAEPGEGFINKRAVAALGGKVAIDRINQTWPRFQKGGIVALGRKLQQQGYDVGEHPAFGGVAPVHTSGSYHYSGQALDINADTMPGGEVSNLNKLYAQLKNMKGVIELLWQTADHYDHLHVAFSDAFSGTLAGGGLPGTLKRLEVTGPKGPLRSMGQAAVDKVHKAAQAYLARRSGVEGAEISGGTYNGPLDRNFGAGSNATISFKDAAMLAEAAGLPGITYAQIAQGESGLRPGAVSPDGGYGLWQMTPRVQSPATVAAWERIGSYFNPWHNAQMAKYLAGSGTGTSNYYGTGFVTDMNKHYTGPMKFQRGGFVEALPFVGSYRNGGVVPRDGMAHVHKNEVITPASARPAARDKVELVITNWDQGRGYIRGLAADEAEIAIADEKHFTRQRDRMAR